MSQSASSRDADDAIRSAVLRLFGENIDHVDVRAVEDPAGEPGLSVTIFLKAAGENMPGRILLDTIAEITTALREIDDFRFPYVTFLAPEYERAEDTNPAS